jgi:hypothetical protein
MISIPRAGLAAAALTLAVVALSACGGSTATTTPGAPVDESPGTSVAGSPGALPSLPIAIPSFDMSGLIQNLDGVDSYRISITNNGETQYSAVVVTKPVLSKDVTIDEQRIVSIGDEVWMGEGDNLVPTSSQLATAMLSAFDPIMLIGAFAQPGALGGAEDLGTEEKNGVQAHHYRIDGDSFMGGFMSFPPGAGFDMWIADEGYLVSLAMVGITPGEELVIDVTNVNDPANVVERPS